MRNLIEYHRPKSLAEALALLSRTEVRTVPLAGGTNLVGRADPSVQAVVDLRDLGLSFIQENDAFIRMGATTTLQALADAPLMRTFANGLIAQTAHTSAASLIRNMASIGGTLISAPTTSDLPPVLLALDAVLTLYIPEALQEPTSTSTAGRRFSSREMSLAQFYESYPSPLAEGGLMTEIAVPRLKAGFGAAYHKVGRTPRDAPILGVAAVVTIAEGKCRRATLAVGGIEPGPIRLIQVEHWLSGHTLDEQLVRQVADEIPLLVDPQSDFRASRQYRKKVCGVLARRALLEAWTLATPV